MRRNILVLSLLILPLAIAGQQKTTLGIPCQLEELTSPQFAEAVELSGGVCIIPMGIIEKHSRHLPLGTDLYEARDAVISAAQKEYAVVFPPYYAGQIFEAKHQPGTIAYSNDLIWQMLEESCEELSRNGMKKIIIFNGHGGSTYFLQYFCQSQLAERKDYVVVLFQPGADPEHDREINALKKAKLDGHAGEEETAMMSYIRPDLVHTDVIGQESGADLRRLSQLPNAFTGIHWYARYPNHFAGDFLEPNARLGELLIEKDAKQLAGLIRYLKNNNDIEQLQDEFFDRSEAPFKAK
ncbi:MAG: creatininase family protein [Bacteroidales bacterium]|nr:creatininase family protein [Bacteroidales bacterium]MDT8373258.1 creatininase family protein [Bacteroidales bacterium]